MLMDEQQNRDDGFRLEEEHYERLVIVIEQWKKKMIDRIDSIAKGKLQRLRDEYERQQLERRRLRSMKIEEKSSNEGEEIEWNNLHIQWIRSASIETEYTLMSRSAQTILLHDGRNLKLFDENLRLILSFDLNQLIRDRSKIVDLCFVPYLSAYLILFEYNLWIYSIDSTVIKPISSIKRRNFLSLTSNNQDVFLLDVEGTIEQRSLVSWTFLRRYNREQLLQDYFHDQMLSIRFHSSNNRYLMIIVRTTNNRRCLMFYQHYGSNTLKMIDRIFFPSINIYTIVSMDFPHRWVITSCERQIYFFDDRKERHEAENHPQEQWIPLDCDHRVKNASVFQRSMLIRTIKPSQIRLYLF